MKIKTNLKMTAVNSALVGPCAVEGAVSGLIIAGSRPAGHIRNGDVRTIDRIRNAEIKPGSGRLGDASAGIQSAIFLGRYVTQIGVGGIGLLR
jgi:hypothetical protein